MKKRQNVPTIPCPGCGQPMEAEEEEFLGQTRFMAFMPDPEGTQSHISWTCENVDCPYGPRHIPPGEILEE